MNKEIEKALVKYYESVGEIENYNESHKEMMMLFYPLLKILERVSK